MDIFDEDTHGAYVLAFTGFDAAGGEAAVAPTSATYTLFDEKTGDIINGRNKTVIGALAASVTLVLTDEDNVIVTNSKDLETHVLFVEFVYVVGLANRKGNAEWRFKVRNLSKES